MCMSCVAAAVTEPVTVTLPMRWLAALTRSIYDTDWGGVGGPLHCELDDFNLEDHWFERDAATPIFNPETLSWHPDADVALCERTWRALAQLTEPERHIAVAIAHGDIYDAEIGHTIRFADPEPEQPPAVTILPDMLCSTCMAAIAALQYDDGHGMWVCSHCGEPHGYWLNGGTLDVGILRGDGRNNLQAFTDTVLGGDEHDDDGLFDG